MNPCGAAFDKHFGEFHDGGETAVAGVGVGDDGTEEVYERGFGAVSGGHVHSCGTLFSVVEELRHEQVFDLKNEISTEYKYEWSWRFVK